MKNEDSNSVNANGELNELMDKLSNYPDLAKRLLDAYTEYGENLQHIVDRANKQKEESRREELSLEESEELAKLDDEAKLSFYTKEKEILVEAVLRQQEEHDSKEEQLKNLKTEYRRIKMFEDREKVGHKVYPNDPCPCGSGKKYKKCCAKKELEI